MNGSVVFTHGELFHSVGYCVVLGLDEVKLDLILINIEG